MTIKKDDAVTENNAVKEASPAVKAVTSSGDAADVSENKAKEEGETEGWSKKFLFGVSRKRIFLLSCIEPTAEVMPVKVNVRSLVAVKVNVGSLFGNQNQEMVDKLNKLFNTYNYVYERKIKKRKRERT